jgi:hypothetical protein
MKNRKLEKPSRKRHNKATAKIAAQSGKMPKRADGGKRPPVNQEHPLVCTEVKINEDSDQTSYTLSFVTHDGVKVRDVPANIVVSSKTLHRALSDFGYNGDPSFVEQFARDGTQQRYPIRRVTSRGG